MRARRRLRARTRWLLRAVEPSARISGSQKAARPSRRNTAALPHLGVRIGCHDLSRCCLNAVSVTPSVNLRTGPNKTHSAPRRSLSPHAHWACAGRRSRAGGAYPRACASRRRCRPSGPPGAAAQCVAAHLSALMSCRGFTRLVIAGKPGEKRRTRGKLAFLGSA